MGKDTGLDTLLEMDGYILDQGDGFWVKIEARRIPVPTPERPHGISYSLTLHDPSGQRILGFDNAHGVRPSGRKRYAGRRVEYDHKHQNPGDRRVLYEFTDPYQLMKDFFEAVDKVLKSHRGY